MCVNILPSGRLAPVFLPGLPGGVEGHVDPLVGEIGDELLVRALLRTIRVVAHAEGVHVRRPAGATVALEVVPGVGSLGEGHLEVVHREDAPQLGPKAGEALFRHSRT